MRPKISSKEANPFIQDIEKAFNIITPQLTRDPTKYKLSKAITNEIVNRFLRDKDLIEDYHEGIKGSDVFKIVGYLIYWIAKLKPVQILEQKPNKAEVHINEHLVISYAISYFYEHNNMEIRDKKLTDNVLYLLRYRTLTVRIMPLILEAYVRGYWNGLDRAGEKFAKKSK